MAKMLKALILDPDGTVRNTEIENALGPFQAVVGGYIEGVFGKVATMYVNEEGLLKRLPSNPIATAFAQQVLRRNVVLFGTALILGPADIEGDDTDVRPAVVDYFTQED